MSRLGILIIVLAVVAAAGIVVQLKVAPLVEAPSAAAMERPRKLSAADQKKLEVAKKSFATERDRFLQMKNSGAPADQLEAQNAKAKKAAEAVVALGGQQALMTVGRSKYAPKPDESGSSTLAGGGSKDKGTSCSGEEGGGCSAEGDSCSVSAEEGKDAKKPASSGKPATKP